jgi:formate dehydrogenase accessory protein FdhE
MTVGKWDARIRRATHLTSVYPFAGEGLRFYIEVASFQRSLSTHIQKSLTDSRKLSSSLSPRDELDLALLNPNFPAFLSLIGQIAPVPLREAAAALAEKGSVGWQRAMEDFWHGDHAGFNALANGLAGGRGGESRDTNYFDHLLAWIYLQPYAEYLAECRRPAALDGTPFTCPLCGASPIVGVLRPEGDGAKKSLICMLCAHEWNFRRLYCPSCGEEREPQLAFYSAPEIPHVRVDVCDTCHTYLKAVDLTKMGLAVPIVDELATTPLDLWAREHGYSKLQINILGT